jgi:hypothetical protein
MGNEVTDGKDVAAPGTVVPGPAGNGTGNKTKDPGVKAKRARRFSLPEKYGDLVFRLFDRQDRIADRIAKKIERLERRLTVPGERGRA